MAIRAFQWLMCAQRPLRISELAEAVTVDQSEATQWEVDDEYVLQICSNFIIADASRVAQFTHLTLLGGCYGPVAEACLSYLLDPPIPVSSIADFEHGLLSYSILFWAVHWEQSSDNRGSNPLGNLFACFISKDQVGSPLMNWLEALPRGLRVLSGSPYYPRWSEPTLHRRLQNSFSESTPVFAACAWGFVEVLLNTSGISNIVWGDFHNGRESALTIACRYGQDEVVQLLLKYGAHITAEELGGAVVSRNEAVVNRLLKHGADINEKDTSEETALLGAVQLGNCSMARFLLENGADITATPPYINTRDGGSYGLYETATVLHIAAHQGNLEMVRLLLENGADVKAGYKFRKGFTPLKWAIGYHHEDVVKVLVEKEAGITGRAALHWAWQKVLYKAAEEGDKEAVLRVLNKRANVNSQDERGQTALYATGTYGNVEITQLLLDYGADVKIKDQSGRTPLHQSSSGSGREVARLLLEYGADIDARDDNKRTTLHEAAKHSHWQVVELLVEKGADIEAKDANNKTPLHEACSGPGGWAERIQFLLQHGADIATETNDGWKALHFAAAHGSDELVDLLLKQDGIDRNPRTKDGTTPLTLAVHRDEESVVRRFLDCGGVDWDSKGRNGCLWHALSLDEEHVVEQLIQCGQVSVDETETEHVYPETYRSTWNNTLLHRAAAKGYLESVRLLLEKGGSVTATNSNGDTPLHRVIESWGCSEETQKDIIWILLNNGADIEAKNHEGTTPLYMAVEQGGEMLSIVRFLIEKGADINSGNKFGSTPLMRAVTYDWEEKVEICKFLLEGGADVKAKKVDGSTVLHIAGMVAYDDKILDLLKLLLDYGADKTAKDKDGKVPLDRRPHWSDSEGVKFLLGVVL